MDKIRVRMLQSARPRNCVKLLAGEEYRLPKVIANRLVAIGKAEILAEETPPAPGPEKPTEKAAQPEPKPTPRETADRDWPVE